MPSLEALGAAPAEAVQGCCLGVYTDVEYDRALGGEGAVERLAEVFGVVYPDAESAHRRARGGEVRLVFGGF